jgi:glutathione S-transferase
MPEPLQLFLGNRNYSSWSLRALLSVRQSGLAFEETRVPLGSAEGKRRIASLSPTARVPLLVWDGLAVWDSLAITELLAELAPDSGIWPRDARARAIARSACAEMHSGFLALREHCPMDIRRRTTLESVRPDVASDVARIDALWSGLRRSFAGGGPFLFGAWSAADAFFAPVVTRIRTYGLAVSSTSCAYVDSVLEWPAMVDVAQEAADEEWVIAATSINGPVLTD